MKLQIIRIVVPFLIAGAGVGASRWIANQAPSAERKPVQKPVPLVEVEKLAPAPKKSTVEATGIVTPAQRVMLMPLVAGEVVHISSAMVPGGHVKKGDVLVRIDPRDYHLAVQQQAGNLRSAELLIEQEQAQQQLAKHEWQVLGEQGEAPPLFTRESQIAAARASLKSGKRGLDRARLNLSRTVLKAPFDATVVSESVDVGQVVGPQSQLAELIGTGEMWVMVSVPVEELALIRIPGVNAEPGEGSNATVRQRLATSTDISRFGKVARLVNQLDERTRRAQVVVNIENPLSTEHGLPLLAGAHVDVQIEGQSFPAMYTLPRETVYEGNTVWVMEGKNILAKRQIAVAWGDSKNVYATSGLKDGDQLVLTRISAPIPGMTVKAINQGSPKPPAAPQTAKADDRLAAKEAQAEQKAEPAKASKEATLNAGKDRKR